MFSGVQPPLCSFHLPRASLNDTEGAESPSSLQGISWDRLDESQSPALSRIRAPTATVVTLHMRSCFSTGTGWLLSHGFCWISSLSVSWHQLFEWAPNVLPWDHWRQPEHINTQLLQWEDADSTSTQPEESRSFMGQIPPKLSFPIQRDLSIGASCSLPYRSSQKGFLYLKPFPFSACAHEEFLKGQCSSCAAV